MVRRNPDASTFAAARQIASVAVAICALAFLSACADSEVKDVPKTTPSVEQTATPEVEATADDGVQTEFEIPKGVPAGFPDIDVPFYSPAELVASPDHGGDPFVLEFVTNDGFDKVESFIETHLVEAAGWSNISRSEEGPIVTTEASKDGYSLIVAVAPERVESKKTSIFYTLRAQ